MANRNWMNGGKLYKMHAAPVEIDMQFTVDSTNPQGITSLSGPCVASVQMHSAAATPAAGNPAAGIIVVKLQDNYNELLAMNWFAESPNSGSDVKIDNSAMTAGQAYVITTLGNATAAKWQAIGVPAGVTPAVGVAFIAASNGGSGNTLTSRVQTAAAAGSGIFSIEITGNPQLSIAPAPSANQGFGAMFILEARNDSSSDAPAVAAPADGTTIGVKFLMNNSSIKIQGS